MLYNAAERKDVRRLEKEAKLADRQRKEIIRGLMSLAPGRAYVLARLEAAHVFSTSFSTSALQMAFTEGERNQGLQLLRDVMDSCPERYVEMMQEKELSDARRATDPPEPDRGDPGSDPEAGDDPD